jgi:hypothetical protein
MNYSPAPLPLDNVAAGAIAGTQRMLGGAPRFPISQQERDEVEKVAKNGGLCLFCAGIHVGASTPACPRLAAGKLNGDGAVVEFTFWNEWDASRVVFPEDVESEDDTEDVEQFQSR